MLPAGRGDRAGETVVLEGAKRQSAMNNRVVCDRIICAKPVT
jgi:hypothetical protein